MTARSLAAAVDGEVLVLAEPGEVKRLAVDQEAVPVHATVRTPKGCR